MSTLNINEQFAEFHHYSQWWWLRLQLAYEYDLDGVRALIRQAREPSKGFKIDANLRRLLNIK